MSADLAEKVRMALAEAGYSDAQVIPSVLGDGSPSALVYMGGADEPFRRACWKAGFLVSRSLSPCWACWLFGDSLACLARGLGLEDCGADRSES